MDFELSGSQTQLLTKEEVREHLGRGQTDTTSLPDAFVDYWIEEAARDCYNRSGFFPASTLVKIHWDRFPSVGRFLKILGGIIELSSPAPVLGYFTESTPTTRTAWTSTDNWQAINGGAVGELWLQPNATWPSADLRAARGVELEAQIGAPDYIASTLRRAMLLTIGTWHANRAEEDEPLVPGSQIQKTNETAERLYTSVSILPPSGLLQRDTMSPDRGL